MPRPHFILAIGLSIAVGISILCFVPVVILYCIVAQLGLTYGDTGWHKWVWITPAPIISSTKFILRTLPAWAAVASFTCLYWIWWSCDPALAQNLPRLPRLPQMPRPPELPRGAPQRITMETTSTENVEENPSGHHAQLNPSESKPVDRRKQTSEEKTGYHEQTASTASHIHPLQQFELVPAKIMPTVKDTEEQPDHWQLSNKDPSLPRPQTINFDSLEGQLQVEQFLDTPEGSSFEAILQQTANLRVQEEEAQKRVRSMEEQAMLTLDNEKHNSELQAKLQTELEAAKSNGTRAEAEVYKLRVKLLEASAATQHIARMDSHGSQDNYQIADGHILRIQGESTKSRWFQSILSPSATNRDVTELLEPMLAALSLGISGGIFTNGASGTGKSKTMYSNAADSIAYWAGEKIFDSRDGCRATDVFLRAVEVLDDGMRDLIDETRALKTFSLSQKITFDAFSRQCVLSAIDLQKRIKSAQDTRTTYSTSLNKTSSRSFLICQIQCTWAFAKADECPVCCLPTDLGRGSPALCWSTYQDQNV
jgi:hypothetical protein